jgi:hypothetical protein
LQSYFEADPSSSFYAVKQAPKINSDGQYQYNHDGRNIRVYTQIDNYLMFSDFLAKLEMNSIVTQNQRFFTISGKIKC